MIIKIDDKIYDYDDNEKDIIWDKTGSQPTSKPDEFRLSKSKFCSGAQCPKMLWLKKYRPDLFDDSVINAAVIATGNDVGDLAMGLFGDYIEVPYDKDLSKMIEGTKELMNKGVENIAEASFTYDGLFCSVDILKNKGDKHVEIYEVKCATEVHEQYYPDVAFQNYVLKQLGYIVDRVCLVHINNQYVRHGDLDINQLFTIEDLTNDAEALYSSVENSIKELREYVKNPDEPDMVLGKYCFSPYECGFWDHCSECLPHPNVFNLMGMQKRTKLKCYNLGLISYESLLAEGKIANDKAKQQIMHETYDMPDEIDRAAISAFLDKLTYPMYFLDFESFFPAIPRYDDSKRYQQICFQYSLHYIEEKGGELKHKEFLAYPGKDPRRELCESLCRDIPMDVCTLAYNKTFEQTRIKEMAAIFPDLEEHLMNIFDNMKDLMVPFRERRFYCREMHGSYSIKYVLPALFPNDPALDYHNLEGVHNGGEAADTFLRMEKMTKDELERYRGYLLKYCGLDTFAMVKIWQKLLEVTNRTC